MLDGIARQLDPDFNAWLETFAYASEVFASEAVVRTWSIPWLDRPDFLSFRAAHALDEKAVHPFRHCTAVQLERW